jgi:hypothetical protein
MADEPKSMLDENQARVARKILERAPAYGVNPDFALSIAMAENMFKDRTSEKGAIGPMQLMPATAKGLKVDPYDEDDNIRGGLLLIRQLSEDPRIKADPIRVLAGYHSGPDLKFFETNDYADLGPNALNYIDRIGKFTNDNIPSVLMSEEQPAAAATPEGNGSVVVSEADMGRQAAQDRMQLMQMGGAGLGATASTYMDARSRMNNNKLDRTVEKIAQALANKAPAGALPTPSGGLPTPSVAPISPIEPTLNSGPSAQSTRILQGGQGDTLGTTGRARQEGYQTETSRRAAVANEIKATNPQVRQILAQAPGMTSSASGVLYPTVEPRPTAGPRPQSSPLTVRGGAPYSPPTMGPNIGSIRPGEPSMGAPMPQAPSGALPPQKPSLARQAINMGRRAMDIPVIGPAATGALGGFGAITEANDAAERYRRGDMLGAGISGLGALGSAAAIIPHPVTRVVGGGLALAAPMANMIVDYMRQSSPLSQAKQTPTGR